MILDHADTLITCLQQPTCDLVARELQTQLAELRTALREADLDKQADLNLLANQRAEIIRLRQYLETILLTASNPDRLVVLPEIARLCRRALASPVELSL